VPPDLLPTPAIAGTIVESPQERENAWNDLVTKFKTLILGPFDRRVRQYEADIAEQESRRSLPGWNFCTFFIHKEGLAMALESVGLVEDALAIYDELSLDLDTVARELASGAATGTATAFANFTNDIQNRIVGTMKNQNNGTNEEAPDHEHNDSAYLFSKNYRERIVRSNISVFDFICYIFLRQKTLILRLANARSARKELGTDSGDGGEDLVLTSEVCWRASGFIHNASRVLRMDLANAYALSHPLLSMNILTICVVHLIKLDTRSMTLRISFAHGHILLRSTSFRTQQSAPSWRKSNQKSWNSRRQTAVDLVVRPSALLSAPTHTRSGPPAFMPTRMQCRPSCCDHLHSRMAGRAQRSLHLHPPLPDRQQRPLDYQGKQNWQHTEPN
jgi:hypothetical protein